MNATQNSKNATGVEGDGDGDAKGDTQAKAKAQCNG
jgi:hypothetical protein